MVLDSAAYARATLAHYESVAQPYWEGTRHHDVTQNIAAFLDAIAGTPPFTVLDFGCGPGRDLVTLTQLGHCAVGLDGAAAFVHMAQRLTGCEVLQQDFLALQLPAGRFDGVFANASLFHVPQQELPKVLRQLRTALKPNGVLFSSNPRGNNEQGGADARYAVFYDLATWRALLLDAGFVEIRHYYRPPGLPRAQQPWLASLWRVAPCVRP